MKAGSTCVFELMHDSRKHRMSEETGDGFYIVLKSIRITKSRQKETKLRSKEWRRKYWL